MDTTPPSPNPGPTPALPGPQSIVLRWSPTIANLAAAMSAAQGAMQNPRKDKVAKVALRNGGSYTFAYADLASVYDAIRTALASNGLAVIQGAGIQYHPEFPPLVTVATRVVHSSGEWVESDCQMVAEESRPQVVASAISYAKRYALQAMLGVVADDDDDGNAASGNHADLAARPPRGGAPQGGRQQGARQPERPQRPTASDLQVAYDRAKATDSKQAFDILQTAAGVALRSLADVPAARFDVCIKALNEFAGVYTTPAA